jgi:plastocyanin
MIIYDYDIGKGVDVSIIGVDEYINSITLNAGDSWYLRFDRKGIFEYYCTYHADEGMRGKIIIIN